MAPSEKRVTGLSSLKIFFDTIFTLFVFCIFTVAAEFVALLIGRRFHYTDSVCSSLYGEEIVSLMVGFIIPCQKRIYRWKLCTEMDCLRSCTELTCFCGKEIGFFLYVLCRKACKEAHGDSCVCFSFFSLLKRYAENGIVNLYCGGKRTDLEHFMLEKFNWFLAKEWEERRK